MKVCIAVLSMGLYFHVYAMMTVLNYFYILTTSELFNTPLEERRKTVSLVNKVDVCLPTHQQLYEGEVMACDVEMNIAVVKIKSDDAIPVATLTPFTDWISISPFGVSQSHADFCLSPYPTKLFPGDEVTIVCKDTCDAFVITGIYRYGSICTSSVGTLCQIPATLFSLTSRTRIRTRIRFPCPGL